MVLFYPLAGICQLKLALWVWLLTDLAKNNIWEGSLGADDHLWTKVPHWLDYIAVDEEGPEFGYTHEVKLRIFQLNAGVFGVQYRGGIDDVENSLAWNVLWYFMELKGQTERDGDLFSIWREHSKLLEIQTMPNDSQHGHVVLAILVYGANGSVNEGL